MTHNLPVKLYLKWIERKGFRHGENFDPEKGANIDAAFCEKISCGDNVTLAKEVSIPSGMGWSVGKISDVYGGFLAKQKTEMNWKNDKFSYII